jgi:hypothetical protein
MGSFGSFWDFEGNSFTKPFALAGKNRFQWGSIA